MSTQSLPSRLSLRLTLWQLIVIALLLYGLLNYLYLDTLVRGAAERGVAKSTVLFALWGLGSMAAVIGMTVVSPRVRLAMVVAMWLSLTVNFALFLSSKMAITRPIVTWLISETGNLWNALIEFGGRIALGAILAAGVLVCLYVISLRIKQEVEVRLSLAIQAWLRRVALSFLLGLPAAFAAASFVWPSGPSLAEFNIYPYLFMASLERAPDSGPVALTAAPDLAAAEKIVLVVDESIRPDELRSQTHVFDDARVIHFEHGYSTGNCSAASNAMLRWGLGREQVNGRHDARANATLWSYAHHAGYKTTMIDAQMTSATQNFIRPEERSQIDTFIPMDSGVDSDVKVAQELQRRFELPGREFIFVVKRGAHFPYGPLNLPASMQSGDKMRDYRAAVAFSTGRFFDTLLSSSSGLHGALVMYTSDHGQYFGEGATHCRGDYLDETYQVPILVVGAQGRLAADLRQAATCWDGPVSHQNLRSTVLQAFGFQMNQVNAIGFPALTSCQKQTQVPRLFGSLPFPVSKRDSIKLELVVPNGVPVSATGSH